MHSLFVLSVDIKHNHAVSKKTLRQLGQQQDTAADTLQKQLEQFKV